MHERERSGSRPQILLLTLLLTAGFLGWLALRQAPRDDEARPGRIEQVPPPRAPIARLDDAIGRLPLAFEANHGQTDGEVMYLARGRSYTLFLTATGAVLALRPPTRAHPDDARTPAPAAVLRVALVGANGSPDVAGLDPLPGTVSYFVGAERTAWRARVPTYGRVRYRDVYPGVDVVYRGAGQHLEYDFIVGPGADPKRIALAIDGATAVELDPAGDVVARTAAGVVRQHRPRVYQEGAGGRTPVEGRYVLEGPGRVRIALGDYDRSRPLVIDPVLTYLTVLPGSGDQEAAGMTVDADGNTYVVGSVAPLAFPSGNPPTTADTREVFVSKLDPTGSTLLWTAYLGGSGEQRGSGIALARDGEVWICGWTTSPDFATANPIQSALGGGADAFVARLDATGSTLLFSTFLGGAGRDAAHRLALDPAGNAYVVGETASTDFPTVNALQPQLSGSRDAFVAKLTPTGTLAYSTFLGGTGDERASGVAVDAAGTAFVAGATTSPDFPVTPGAAQARFGGGADAFVARLDATGTGLLYATYLGGADLDAATAIALDPEGHAYVTGGTASADFPTVHAAQSARRGASDAFVAELDALGTTILYSTYLGGSGDENVVGSDLGAAGGDIAVDEAGRAWVTGVTASADFPAVAPALARGGGQDVFLAVLEAGGAPLLYAGAFGGTGTQTSSAIALAPSGGAYVAGTTTSADFPLAPGAVHAAPAAASADGVRTRAFVAKIASVVASKRKKPEVASPATITVTETVTVVDAAPVVLTPASVAVAEAVAVADALTVIPPAGLTIAEAVSVVDTPLVVPPASVAVAEGVTVADAPGAVPPATVAVAEAVAVADADVAVPPASVDVSEAVVTGDAPLALPPATIVVAEALAIADGPAAVPPADVAVTEAVAVADANTSLPPVVLDVTEVVLVSDAPAAVPPASIDLGESVAVSDS